MPIRFKCPKCRQILEVSTSQAGRETSCSGCGASIRVPKPKSDTSDPLAELVAAITSTEKREKPPSEEPKAADESRLGAEERQPSPPERREVSEPKAPQAKPPETTAPQEAKRPERPVARKAEAVEEASAYAARPAERRERLVLQRAKKAPPANKGFGAAALLLLAGAVGLFFIPWVDLIVAKVGPADSAAEMGQTTHTYGQLRLIKARVSPASFVVNTGKIIDASKGWSPSSEKKPAAGEREGTARRPARRGKGESGGGVVVVAPFVYAVGLVVAIVGAFQIFRRWQSLTTVFGFAICLLGLILALIGLEIFHQTDTLDKSLEAGGGLICLIFTPWFYAAFLAGSLGFAFSVLAVARRPRS
ncbi:MAG: hypothetical protein ACYTF6_00715 [Planctomycetota bacterium]|jgi:hypothetical protein